MVPIEPFRVIINDSVDNVRQRLAKSTSAYSDWRTGIRIGIASNPNSLFVGEVGERHFKISFNSSGRNSGRPLLRAQLVDDNNGTIITGRLGLQSAVVLLCGLTLIPAFEKPTRVLPVVLGVMLVLIGGGYLYGRRQLFRALATCLNVEISKFR